MKRKISLVVAGLMLASGFAMACNKEQEDIAVYMPDGAPALALAGLMAEDTDGDGVSYNVVPVSLIASKVTYKEESKNADLCVMPVTAASKLLGNGDRYVMLGAVTHGNLYLLAKDGEVYTADNLSSLVGKKVGVLQINEVPGLTFKATLNKYDIPWQELKSDGTAAVDKVNLVAISGPEAVGAIDADCYMIAEPAASAQAKKGYSIVGDLQSLYGGEKGYTQAVLVAKKSLVEEKSAWTKEFVAKVEGSAEWLSSVSGEQIVAAVAAHMEDKDTETSLKAPLLSSAVLARCGIYFTYAKNCAMETETFLAALLAVNGNAAAIPQQQFYWEYTK